MKIRRIIGIVLAAVIMGTGCNVQETKEETTFNTENTGSTVAASDFEIEATETTAAPLFVFNPHVYSPKIAERIPEEYWDSFYNLCDALREGKTEFECSSIEAYAWCTDMSVLCNYFPAAATRIEAVSDDGSDSFADGIGRISYNIPVEEYIKRQSDFESLIAGILNSCIESNDNEYERALKLYLYIADNYEYDDDIDYEDNFVYHTFTTGKGMCVNFASVYAYLLLQAGIDAVPVSVFEEYICHSWTYAVINGKGYHMDVTWALKDSYEGNDYIYLDYFMMSDQERNIDGCPVDNLAVSLLPEYWVNRTGLSFKASDSHYNLRDFCHFDYLDEENKIVHCTDMSDEKHEFSYK